jgi:hypothetical protein
LQRAYDLFIEKTARARTALGSILIFVKEITNLVRHAEPISVEYLRLDKRF